jgi:acyl-CoA hydrolase
MFAPSRPERIRLCTSQEAAALVRSGDKIAISANANTPRVWLEALFARAEQLEDVEIMGYPLKAGQLGVGHVI